MQLENAAVFDGEEPLSKALNEILTTGTVAVITEKGRYYGIIDDREMRGGISDSSKAKCINMAVRAPSISEKMGTDEMMDRFLAGHFKALPVTRAGRVIGLMSRSMLMQRLIVEKSVPKISVEIIMNTPLYTVDANESVAVAKRVMKTSGVHRLAITQNNKVIGTVSTMDFAGVLLKPKGRDFMFERSGMVEKTDAKAVHEFMRDKFVSVNREDSLHVAVERMAANNVSAVVVMEGAKAIGVVTARDVMKFILGLHSEKPEVFISGLGQDDMEYYDSIREELKGSIKKFGETFEIDTINVRIKKGKSTYVVTTHVALEHGPIRLKVEAYDLKSAIAGTAAEIKSLLDKKKNHMKTKKRPFYAEEAYV
ncbi:MAG: CBS domain-containing protein [Candidatus Micrarchaeota archaeon]|nr:CBS domain-containing protein [Candidatus Micrarchaeota archaeon]